jgi:hypothetical protein
VIVSPGPSVPDDRLRYSQLASVHAAQRTGDPPDAVSVMRVLSPAGSASTVIRPGPMCPGPDGGTVPSVLTTSTETSGERRFALNRGSGVTLALPAFS